MAEDTKKAVDYASRGNVTRFEDEVTSILDRKASERLEAIRREVAQDLLHIEALAPRPKTDGEKKFVGLHKISKRDHPVAPENQFTCAKPKAKRNADSDVGDSEGISDDPESTVSKLRQNSVAVGPTGV